METNEEVDVQMEKETNDESWDGESSEEEDEDLEGRYAANDDSVALTWRMDPKESFSDWTIVILWQDRARSETYHVHKQVLAFGYHRSEYFARLFRSEALSEHESNTSKIQLQDLAANAFSLFLDYLYDVPIDNHRSVALYHLADFFQVDALRKEIEERTLPEVSLENACHFYSDAVSFEPPIEAFVERVEKVCIRRILEIQTSSSILPLLRPDSFLAIVEAESHLSAKESDHLEMKNKFGVIYSGLHVPPNASQHLSMLVVAYCKCHDDIDADVFNRLTDKDILPTISFDAAQSLVELKESIVGMQESDLEQRCFAAIGANVDRIGFENSGDKTLQFLRSRPSKWAVDTMSAMHSALKRDHESAMNMAQIELFSQKNLVRGLESRCSDYERQFEEYRMRFQLLEDSGCDSDSESETSDSDSDMDTDSSSGNASESEYTDSS